MEFKLMIARSKSIAPQEHSNLARYHSPRQGDGAVGLLFDDMVCRLTCYASILLYGVEWPLCGGLALRAFVVWRACRAYAFMYSSGSWSSQGVQVSRKDLWRSSPI